MAFHINSFQQRIIVLSVGIQVRRFKTTIFHGWLYYRRISKTRDKRDPWELRVCTVCLRNILLSLSSSHVEIEGLFIYNVASTNSRSLGSKASTHKRVTSWMFLSLWNMFWPCLSIQNSLFSAQTASVCDFVIFFCLNSFILFCLLVCPLF